MSGMEHTPESELVARLRERDAKWLDARSRKHPDLAAALVNIADDIRDAAATIERLDSELRLCRAALLAERMCADILEDGGEERLVSTHEKAHASESSAQLRAIERNHSELEQWHAHMGYAKTQEHLDRGILLELFAQKLARIAWFEKLFTFEPDEAMQTAPNDPVTAGKCVMPLTVLEGVQARTRSAHEQGRREGIEMLQEAREHVALRLDGMERIGATAEAKRSARSLLQRMDAALAKEGTP